MKLTIKAWNKQLKHENKPARIEWSMLQSDKLLVKYCPQWWQNKIWMLTNSGWWRRLTKFNQAVAMWSFKGTGHAWWPCNHRVLTTAGDHVIILLFRRQNAIILGFGDGHMIIWFPATGSGFNHVSTPCISVPRNFPNRAFAHRVFSHHLAACQPVVN